MVPYNISISIDCVFTFYLHYVESVKFCLFILKQKIDVTFWIIHIIVSDYGEVDYTN